MDFRFRITHGSHFHYSPSHIVSKIAEHLGRYTQAWIVTSPHGVLIYAPAKAVAYLVRESHTRSALWYWHDGRVQFVTRVDPAPLAQEFVGRVIYRADRNCYYSDKAVLPVISRDELGYPDRSILLTAIPGELFTYRGTIQTAHLHEFLDRYNHQYYPMPAGSTLSCDSDRYVLRFRVGDTEVLRLSKRDHMTSEPLQYIASALWSADRIQGDLYVRLGDPASARSSYFYDTKGIESVSHLLPQYRLGLLATDPRDPFIRTLQSGRGPEKFMRVIRHVLGIHGADRPYHAISTEFEVLGVYSRLDGSTGKIVWYTEGRAYRPKRSQFDYAKLMRVYHLYVEYGDLSSRTVFPLLSSIVGSRLYACPVDLSCTSFTGRFVVTDDGTAVSVGGDDGPMFCALKIRSLFLDTGRDDYRLVLADNHKQDPAAYPIILAESG